MVTTEQHFRSGRDFFPLSSKISLSQDIRHLDSKFHFKNEFLRNKDIWAPRCTSHFWNRNVLSSKATSVLRHTNISIYCIPEHILVMFCLWAYGTMVSFLFPFQLCPWTYHLFMESKTPHRLGVRRVVKTNLGQFQPSIRHPVSDVRRGWKHKYFAGLGTTVQSVQYWGTQNLIVKASFKIWECFLLSSLWKVLQMSFSCPKNPRGGCNHNWSL